MSWLPQDYGRGPGEIQANAHITQGLPYHQPRNQWADLIASLTPAIRDFIKNKRNDQIADQLMNMQQPPRAEAVDQSGATYDPVLAASQGLTGPEPQASDPYAGGAEGYQAQQMYQDRLDKDEDRTLRRLNTQSLIDARNQPESLTLYQQEMIRLREQEEARQARTADAKPGTDIISKSGVSVEDLDTPNLVKFYKVDPEDKEGKRMKPISGAEAETLGDQAYAQAPGSDDYVPYDQWQAAAGSLRKRKGVTPKGQPSGTTDNNAVLQEARDAIKSGKDPEAVKKRLSEMNIDPSLL